MKTIYESESTPKKDGFYMPGEYEEQERTWILWPHRSDVWRCGAKPAQKVFIEIIKTVARFQPITVGVNAEDFPAVCEIFDGVENVRVIHMEYNDSWIRDPGPAFLVNDNGEVALSHFHFKLTAVSLTACISRGTRTLPLACRWHSSSRLTAIVPRITSSRAARLTATARAPW